MNPAISDLILSIIEPAARAIREPPCKEEPELFFPFIDENTNQPGKFTFKDIPMTGKPDFMKFLGEQVKMIEDYRLGLMMKKQWKRYVEQIKAALAEIYQVRNLSSFFRDALQTAMTKASVLAEIAGDLA